MSNVSSRGEEVAAIERVARRLGRHEQMLRTVQQMADAALRGEEPHEAALSRISSRITAHLEWQENDR